MHLFSRSSAFASMGDLNQKCRIKPTKIYQNLNNSQKSTLLKHPSFSGFICCQDASHSSTSCAATNTYRAAVRTLSRHKGASLLLILHRMHPPMFRARCNTSLQNIPASSDTRNMQILINKKPPLNIDSPGLLLESLTAHPASLATGNPLRRSGQL